jgi:tetratricopeptide (TPR) repeat protein
VTSALEEAKYLFELGLYFFEKEDFARAEEQFKEALRLAPDRPSILVNLSATLIQFGKWDECEKTCQKILSIEPSNYDALLNLSICLTKTQRELQALQRLDQVIEINPDSDQAWTNKGNILQEIGKLTEASDCFNAALSINHQSQEALIGRGNLQNELKEYHAALEDLDAVLKLNPSNAQAKWNKALSLLRLGNFEEGWQLYEARWQVPGMREHTRNFNVPLWLGNESLKNKTILIHAEQGYGDTIQFSRYIPLLESKGAKVILEVPKSLTSLMYSLSTDIKVVERNTIDAQDFEDLIDFHCPIMSLALAFSTTLDTIPQHTPYLFVNEKTHEIWRNRLAKISNQTSSDKTIFRVGIAWSGSGHYAGKNNLKRDVPTNDITDLINCFDQKNIEFHSLQVEDERNKEIHRTIKRGFYSHAQQLKNFSDTAALMAGLDLIISIDTATAHLAGALNLPTLLLIPDPPDFMALISGNKTPWYSSTRLLRQKSAGDWTYPLNRAKNLIGTLDSSNNLESFI